MIGLSLKQSQEDHTLFVKHSVPGGVTMLLVYVDDIIVTCDDEAEQQLLRKYFTKEFEIKTLGKLKYFISQKNTLLVFSKRLARHHESLQVHQLIKM